MDNSQKGRLNTLIELLKHYTFNSLFTVSNNIWYLTSENELCLKGTIQNYLQGVRFEDLQDEYNFEVTVSILGTDVTFVYRLYSVNDPNKTMVVSNRTCSINIDTSTKTSSRNIYVFSPKEKKNILINNNLISIQECLIREYDRHCEYLLNDLIDKFKKKYKTKGEKKMSTVVIDHRVDDNKPVITISKDNSIPVDMTLPEAYEFLKECEKEGSLDLRLDEEYESGYIFVSDSECDDEDEE